MVHITIEVVNYYFGGNFLNYSKKVLTCASALVISLGIFAGYSTTTFAASTSQNTSTK